MSHGRGSFQAFVHSQGLIRSDSLTFWSFKNRLTLVARSLRDALAAACLAFRVSFAHGETEPRPEQALGPSVTFAFPPPYVWLPDVSFIERTAT